MSTKQHSLDISANYMKPTCINVTAIENRLAHTRSPCTWEIAVSTFPVVANLHTLNLNC